MCNCGVAVRSGDSLFVTNFCETELTNGERRTNNYIIQRLCDDQNLIVEETGDKFKVVISIILILLCFLYERIIHNWALRKHQKNYFRIVI